MDEFRGFYTIVVLLLVLANTSFADHEYMVNTPENVILPVGFETSLSCEMNLRPDKFVWKFYPLAENEIYNPKAPLDLNSRHFEQLSPDKVEDSNSILNVKIQKNHCGDYQCLAYYGASVVASVPSRITISMLGNFTDTSTQEAEVTVDNTVIWRCNLPFSNPEPFVDYYKNGESLNATIFSVPIKSLVIENVTRSHSGIYKCAAGTATDTALMSKAFLNLRVSESGTYREPWFIVPSKTLYTVTKGTTVYLECAAVGNPVPRVFWYKENGELPRNRTELVKGGLKITNISSHDEGVYTCEHKNNYGNISERITLKYNEEPSIECYLNTTEVKQGEKLDIDCTVRGIPKPRVVWFLNGYSVKNDSAIEAIANKIYFSPVEKRHAGYLQCFATNSVRTVYKGISVKVIPISTSGEGAVPLNHRHNGRKNHPPRKPSKPMKPPKLIPPNKPTVRRKNDQGVVVQWSVNSNTGLSIMFFKVQYRELGPLVPSEHHRNKGSRWKTCNDDIAPHITSYDVNGLKPDHVYRFRIAAVYSNNDNKLSNNSSRFYLRKADFDEDNKPPIPLITNTESVNTSAVKIYWKCPPAQNTTEISGYLINFISASRAGDFSIQTVHGNDTSSYVLSHLQPDTFYDIKMQSYTSKILSDYSQIMKAKTLANHSSEVPTVQETSLGSPEVDTGGISNLYIIIAASVVGGGVVLAGIALLIGCRKWKQKKNADSDRHKPAVVEDHHIQAENEYEYVVSPRSLPRTNGCALPTNRITITANPLADDNKSQNMIELTCLSSQNNNCTTQPTSTDQEDSPPERRKHTDPTQKQKLVDNSPTSGENYV